jgi:DNA-binding transcriptional MocR family regulator
MIAELVMGPQATATEKFRSLSPKEKRNFSGWKMDGWVRWLEGLRGQYERRMNRMCTILDEGSIQLKQSTPVRESDQDWGVITKTQLYEFDWPRGGMFIWVRMNYETHPLWMAEGNQMPVINGPILSTALMMLLTHKPFLVLASPGMMFSPTDEIRMERGWAYFRLCFAAESEENVDSCSKRFADGVQRFWRIKNVEEIEALAGELNLASNQLNDFEGVASIMGC